MDVSVVFVADQATQDKMIEMVTSICGRDRPAVVVWKQLLGAIHARNAARNPSPDDRP